MRIKLPDLFGAKDAQRAPRGARRSRTTVRSAAFAWAALALVLAGCGAGAGGGTTTQTPTGSSHASASASGELPGIVAYGGATYVSGRAVDFRLNEGTVTTDTDGSSHSRGGSFTYQLRSDDPRVDGLVTGTWNSDRWGVESNGALVQWGEATLTNDKGSWVGAYAGVMATPIGDMISRWWTGTGAYQGLTFFFWLQGDIFEATWHGLIYPGDPPPGSGS
jgi:hypothetical protein